MRTAVDNFLAEPLVGRRLRWRFDAPVCPRSSSGRQLGVRLVSGIGLRLILTSHRER